jgi:hypothetical protein
MVNADDDKFGVARDAKPPLDSVMLGLEEQMGDVVDVRPDRFLREMREHGNVNEACKAAGLPRAELEDLCRVNTKFDLAQVEVYLEFMEDAMMAEARKRVASLRDYSLKEWQARHGINPDG